MHPIRAINLGLRFALELCALAALAYWGWQSSDSLLARLALAIAAPAIGAVIWGLWAAPNSRRQLPDPWRLIPEVIVFGSASVGLVVSGNALLGAALAALYAVNRALLSLFPAQSGSL